MKAAADEQLRLLDLQSLDTRLDQLAHRRSSLPELAEIAGLDERLTRLRGDLVRVETQDSDQGREQTKIENEIDLVRTRAVRDQQRLDAGQVSSPRELENLQHEIGSLATRQAELEDRVLEVMERREALQGSAAELAAERDRLTTQRTDAEQRRDRALAEIAAAAAEATARRSGLAGELPGDLLTLYEKVRAASGGVGAAALHRGRCEGCHLSLSGSELAGVRAAAEDEVVRCDECRRILVRTAESGV
ncbi:MAG: zinc ribbon domain-containing protein [Frankiaceae bacterium]